MINMRNLLWTATTIKPLTMIKWETFFWMQFDPQNPPKKHLLPSWTVIRPHRHIFTASTNELKLNCRGAIKTFWCHCSHNVSLFMQSILSNVGCVHILFLLPQLLLHAVGIQLEHTASSLLEPWPLTLLFIYIPVVHRARFGPKKKNVIWNERCTKQKPIRRRRSTQKTALFCFLQCFYQYSVILRICNW